MNQRALTMHVVLCTHLGTPDRAALLARTLQSLAQVELPAELSQVWVIENGSHAAGPVCQPMQDRLPLRYVHRPEPGKSRALQQAMDTIGTGLAIFTDDDVRFGCNWLIAYRTAAAAADAGTFFGGPVLADYQTPPPDWLLGHMPASATGWRIQEPDPPITTPCFLGANYAAFVEAVQRVGGFRADLGVGSAGNPVGEETELQQRLLEQGHRAVYVPEATVWHHVPPQRCSPRWVLQRCYRAWYTNGMTSTRRHEGRQLWGAPRWMWRRAWHLRLAAWLAALHPDPARRFQSRKRYYEYRGYLDGLRTRHTTAGPVTDAPPTAR